MSVYTKEYTVDPTSGKYKKLFGTSFRSPVTGRNHSGRHYIEFFGIIYQY
jgi:hypothetical protein